MEAKENITKIIRTTLFPPNHNSLVKTVVAGWDGNKGEIFVEEDYNIIYIESRRTQSVYFDDKSKFIEAMEKMIELIQNQMRAETYDLQCESEISTLITFFKGNRSHTLVVPNTILNTVQMGDKVKLTFWAKGDIPIKSLDFDAIYIDVTNDPYQSHAGDWGNLGYYCRRWELIKCKLIDDNPFTFECKLDNYKATFNKMCRRLR